MVNEEQIFYEIHNLPENQKQEVFDFVQILKLTEKTNKQITKGRVFGRSKGHYLLSKDFDETLEEFNEYM